MAIFSRARQQRTETNSVPVTATPSEITSAEKVTPEQRTVEYGSTGVINYQGFLQSEEYNRELLPPDSFAIYDRMAVSDPVVRATMLHMATPIKAAEWRIQPASDSDEDLMMAAFIECNLFEWMSTPWADCMDDQLKYLRWGVAVLEEVWEHRTVGWEYRRPGEGDPVTVPPRDVYTLRKMAPRLPRTIFRWINDPDSGDLAIVQTKAWKTSSINMGGQYVTVDIPSDKCLILSNEKVGDDWWGVSMLRGAYKPWWLLEAMQRVTAIGYERFYVGTPMARMNANATDPQRNKMLRILTDIRSGERASIVYSSSDGLDCDEEGKISTSGNSHAIWILQPDKAPPDSVPWIRQLESNIFTSIMARFMDLGQRETGARATAEIQDDPFYLGLVAVANHVAETWNRGPIKRLIDANFPNVDKYPSLVPNRIAPEDIPIIASAAAAYAGVGFLTPDFSTEQHIRTLLDFPDKVLVDEQIDQGGQNASGDQLATKYPSILGLQQEANKQAADVAKTSAAAGGAAPKGGSKSAQAVRPPVQARAARGTSDGGGGTALHTHGEDVDADPTLGDDPGLPFGLRRELHPDEAHVDFSEISQRVDDARNAFPHMIAQPLSNTIERLVREMSAVESAREAAAVRAKDLGPLSNAIHDALVSIAGYGVHTVERELVRQMTPGVELAEPLHDQLVNSGSTDHLRQTSEATSASIGAAIEQVAKQEALAQIRRSGTVTDPARLLQVVQAEGVRQSTLNSMLLATEALNIGRETAANQNADDIHRVRYTSLMDRASCGPCELADGTVTELGSDQYRALNPPNPRCQGGPRCRCIWVYLT